MLQEAYSSDSSEGEYEEDCCENSEETQAFVSLFCDTTVNSFSAFCELMKEAHNLDFVTLMSRLSFYEAIKLINYTRSSKCDVAEFLQHHKIASTLPEHYLQPVLQDDSLLMVDFKDLQLLSQNGDNSSKNKIVNNCNSDYDDRDDKIKFLEMKLEQASKAYMGLLEKCKNSTSSDAYFDSYADYGIHSEMLKDRARTEAYRDFIYGNPSLFEGNSVMDVGCGTGILSMFCAKGGAKSVVAVDNSDIVNKAQSIIKRNKLHNIINVVRGKVEEIMLDNDSKFDIIVSEWMGYGLLFECMLDSIIVARDKYLRPGGTLLPNRSSMLVSAVSDEQSYSSRINFWENVYDFDMSDIIPDVLKEAAVQSVNPETIISPSCGFKHLDLNFAKIEDLEFESEYRVQVERTSLLTGLVIYFTCFFDGPTINTVLDTSPHSEPTHWAQTVLYLQTPMNVNSDDVISGKIKFEKSAQVKRGYIIRLSGKVERSGTLLQEFKHGYYLS